MASSCAAQSDFDSDEFLRGLYARATETGVPLHAGIEITERCNLRCHHCYLGDQDVLRTHRGRELSAERWCRIIDQIAEMGCLRLLITGGDPMLRKDFAAIYRHARESGLFVTVFTNGTLITPRILELFRELPPYAVEISLYGATKETYEKVTGIPGSYERCLSGIEQLRQLGVDLGIKTVLMKTNQHELHQMAAMARTMGNIPFRFDVEIQGEFQGTGSPLQVRLNPEEAVALEMSDAERFEGWRAYREQRKGLRVATPERLYNCGAGRGMFHINAYGGLQPCLVTRHLALDLQGLALADGLLEIRSVLDQKRTRVDRSCNTCEHRLICNSCPAFSVLENGREDLPAQFQCRATQARVVALEIPRRNM